MVILVLVMAGGLVAGCLGNQEVDNDHEEIPTPVNDEEEEEIDEEEEIVDEDEETMSERDYFYDMIDFTEEANDIQSKLVDLSRKADFSEEWKDEVMKATSRLKELISDVEEITPPSEMEEIHEEYLAGVEKYKEAVDYYRGGAEREKEDAIKDAVKLLREGEEHLNRGYTMLYEYGF